METNKITRMSAVPIQAKDFEQAEPVSKESWNFFSSPIGIVQRVSIMGLLVSWDGSTGLIDDGTGKALVRSTLPGEMVKAPLGSIMLCIGKIRTVGSEKYVSIETSKILREAYWLTYRKFEAALFRSNKQENEVWKEKAKKTMEETAKQETKLKEYGENSLMDTIRLLDAGDGADTGLVMRHLGLEDDSQIHKMIREGVVFEIRPGKIKILE